MTGEVVMASAKRNGGWREVEACVREFGSAMRGKLKANQHKGNRAGWRTDSPQALLRRLREEVAELEHAVATGGDVRKESADVGNFAMMVADSCGVLMPVGGRR